MVFEDGYVFGLKNSEIELSWSNLQENLNFIFTSKQTWEYNCVMWSLNRDDEWRDFFYSDDGYVNPDQSINPYVAYFQENGFETCENSSLEVGALKICIFSKNGIFSHVSRQLQDGRWASKMGNYEDIEHLTEFDVSGLGYGSPDIYMQKIMAYDI